MKAAERQASVRRAKGRTGWLVPILAFLGLMLVAAECYDEIKVVLSFSVVPPAGEAPLTVSASWTLNDTAIGSADCIIDFGDGSEAVTILDCLEFSGNVPHVFQTPGEYTVRLQVRTDQLGDPASSRSQRQVTVYEPGATRLLEVELLSVGGGSGMVVDEDLVIQCSNSPFPGFPGGSCFASFLLGSEVRLHATPSPDSYFAGWGGDGTGSEPRVVVMDADKAVTASFAIGEPAPGETVTVEVIDDSGEAIDAQAVAVQVGSGGWAALGSSETGHYEFELEEGVEAYGVTVRCNDGQIKTYQLSTAETTSLVVPCPVSTPIPDPVNYLVSYSGMAELGTGTSYLARLYGPGGQIGIGGGVTGGFTVPNQPSTAHDLILVGDIDGALAGAKILRDFAPSQGEVVTFEFTGTDGVDLVDVSPYAGPQGFSGLHNVFFCTAGGTSLGVGSGNQAGGSYAGMPFAEDGDLIVAAALALGQNAYVRDAQVRDAQLLGTPDPITFGFAPPWNGFVAPVPAVFPTFTGLDHLSEDEQHRGYGIVLAWASEPGPPDRFWRHFVSEDWLRLRAAESFTAPDLTGVPGLEDLEPTGVVNYEVGSLLANLAVEEFLNVRGHGHSHGLPLLAGLRLREAGAMGTFQAP